MIGLFTGLTKVNDWFIYWVNQCQWLVYLLG